MKYKVGDKFFDNTAEDGLEYVKIIDIAGSEYHTMGYEASYEIDLEEMPITVDEEYLDLCEKVVCFPWENSSSGATSENSPTKCSCSSYNLFNFGCKCGGV